MKYLIAFIVCLLLALPSLAEENEWTAPEEEKLPSGEVLKWCEPNTGKIRYSTEVVPGYSVCGEVQTVKTCDPTGKRFISKDQKAPYAFKDCSIGKRLTVVRLDPLTGEEIPSAEAEKPETALDKPSKSREIPEPDPMSTREIIDAKSTFDKLERDQQTQMAVDVQQIFQSLGQVLSQANQEIEKEMKQKSRRRR